MDLRSGPTGKWRILRYGMSNFQIARGVMLFCRISHVTVIMKGIF